VQELIEDFLADYLDATLSPDVVADLQRHLALCPPCVAYLNTYQQTRELLRQSGPPEMLQEMKAILRKFLLNQLAKEDG
jgi:anti-sigma factor RsiW